VRPPRSWPRRARGPRAGAGLAGAVLAGILAVAVAASSCTTNRNALGTGASPCYQAIPVAARAVHGHGRFVGVRRVPARTVRAWLGERGAARRRTFCLVAYRDEYEPGSVEGAPPAASGPYAVLVVSSPGDHLVRGLILRRLPLRFSHL
jgi:hypothetical protein